MQQEKLVRGLVRCLMRCLVRALVRALVRKDIKPHKVDLVHRTQFAQGLFPVRSLVRPPRRHKVDLVQGRGVQHEAIHKPPDFGKLPYLYIYTVNCS